MQLVLSNPSATTLSKQSLQGSSVPWNWLSFDTFAFARWRFRHHRRTSGVKEHGWLCRCEQEVHLCWFIWTVFFFCFFFLSSFFFNVVMLTWTWTTTLRRTMCFEGHYNYKQGEMSQLLTRASPRHLQPNSVRRSLVIFPAWNAQTVLGAAGCLQSRPAVVTWALLAHNLIHRHSVTHDGTADRSSAPGSLLTVQPSWS